MSRLKNFFHRLPIRTKLGSIFFFVFLLLFGVMILFYVNVNATVRQIDEVYASNTRLNRLGDSLENVQYNLYQYLSTKSSTSLENFYFYEREYKSYLESLNKMTLSTTPELMEKNLRFISESYLNYANEAVEAKRARNITLYRELHEDAQRSYQYLNAMIQATNNINFRENSENYLVLRSALDDMMGAGVIFLSLIVLLAIIWILLMTKSITEPLVLMAGAATEIASGNMEANFPYINTGDELGAVAKASNKMLDNIRQHIEQTKIHMQEANALKENQLMMRGDLNEAQLKYLQAQVNPHFLFNTLNAGVQLSMMEGAERTGLFLEHVADFFRYNVKKMGEDTTIWEELQLIDNYIYILNVRYSGDIKYQKQLDSRLLTMRIPSMVLQPVVENAVNHGIGKAGGEGTIQLSVSNHENKVVISIKDDGVGIDDETIERIMNRGQRPESEGTGIGLDNVMNRLHQYFGQQNVFMIRNRLDGTGTEVLLHLPII